MILQPYVDTRLVQYFLPHCAVPLALIPVSPHPHMGFTSRRTGIVADRLRSSST